MAGKKKLCKEGESDWDKDIRNMPSMERLFNEKKVRFLSPVCVIVCLYICYIDSVYIIFLVAGFMCK